MTDGSEDEPVIPLKMRVYDNDKGVWWWQAAVMMVMMFFATGESEDGQRLRFQVELEFVQCLANPNYLLCEY